MLRRLRKPAARRACLLKNPAVRSLLACPENNVLKTEVHHGKTLPPEREPHGCKNRSHGRYHDLYDDGLHSCGQPQHSVCSRYGCKGSSDRHFSGSICRHHAHGIPGKLPLCTGTRHGPERLLCLHRCALHGLQLADGSAGRLC